MNKHHALSKDKLDVGDICNITIERNICGAMGAEYFPIAVMELVKSTNGRISYKVVTRNGFLKRKYQTIALHAYVDKRITYD